MSFRYDPDDGAQPDSFWGPLFLSNRDVTGQAPINKVTWPGVYLTQACFSDGVYDNVPFQTCLSNLLASEYRRTIVDIYWDYHHGYFNLCPVQLPQPVNSSAVAALSISQSWASSETSSPESVLEARQATTGDRLITNEAGSANATTTASQSTTTNTSSTTTATIATTTGISGTILYELGSYRCSDDLTLQSVIDIYEDYLESSSDPVQARFQILQLNLHAAIPLDNPTGSPETPSSDQMPLAKNLVSAQFDGYMGRSLYTPSILQVDRSNINASWFSVASEDRLPIIEYYNTYTTSGGFLATDNGWPNEKYLLFVQQARLALEWGIISPEMQGYNFAGDYETVFPRGYLTSNRTVDSNSNGIVTSGCFYSDATTSVDQVNNSWAVVTLNQATFPRDIALIDNITACGISPILNTTINNYNADEAPADYQQLTNAALLGWAINEPRNVSSPSTIMDGPAEQNRCALISSTPAYRGHWRVANCQRRHRAACRIDNQPYRWRLSRDEVSFYNAASVCNNIGTFFSIPMTGLENTYLYNQILSDTSSSSSTNDSIRAGVWVNLNDLDVTDCWVTTGPNGTCAYQQQEDERHQREVLIPTIAALLVLLLTAMTILVKCNVNRRNVRQKRTGPGGWEYEGVPS